MKKWEKIIALLFVSAIFLAGCSFGGSSTSDSSASKSDSSSKSKSINVSIGSEPPTLDPQLATDNVSGEIIKNVFEGLTRSGSDGKVEYAAAESSTVSDDGLTYTFKLRKDAVWSNGDAVTAGDFAYAWKRALNPATASEYASLLYVIKGAEAYNSGTGSADDVGVKAVGDYTLEVTLNNPTAYFLELVENTTYMPVNEKVVEANKNWASDAGEKYVTNGAFDLTTWSHSDSIVLTKSKTYWDKDNVNLDKVKVAMVESEATANSMYQAGELDFLGSPLNTVSLDSIDTYKKDKTLKTADYAALYEYKLNTTAKYTSNVNIRKALALAIDRSGLIKNVLKGGQTAALGMVPPTIDGFEKDRGYMTDADFKDAKEYLAKGMKELGITNASDITIAISINTNEAHSAIAQYIQEGWAKNLGINVTIDNSEWQVYLDKLTNMDYTVGRLGWIADYNDASTFLDMYSTADNGNNETGWENADFKSLIDEAATKDAGTSRTKLLLKAEKIMMDEMPVIPIYYYSNQYVASSKVKNMAPDKLGFVDLKSVDTK